MAIGTTANNYEILSKLAEGGMAELFLARVVGATGIRRHVVLKRITRERASDTQYVQMFLDEARLAAQLSHPNIAQVFDIGRLGASYFFTMEYVHGVTVHELLTGASARGMVLPIGAVLAIIAGTAAGLEHAHTRVGVDGTSLGIIHRDVSPSNLIVSYEGHVKVVDFGVAKAVGRPETVAGEIKGKVGYLSPEQCRLMRLDRRTDLYALGICAWEMLTGKRLWKRETAFTTMTAIATEKAPLPSMYRQDLPVELDNLVGKLLAVEVGDRFQTAAAVIDSVELVAQSTRSSIASSQLARLMRELFGAPLEPWHAVGGGDSISVTSTPIPAELETIDDPAALGEVEYKLTERFPTVDTESEDISTTNVLALPVPPSRPPPGAKTRQVLAMANKTAVIGVPVEDPEAPTFVPDLPPPLEEGPTHRVMQRTMLGAGEPRAPNRLSPLPRAHRPSTRPPPQPGRGSGPATALPNVPATVIDVLPSGGLPRSGGNVAPTQHDALPPSGPAAILRSSGAQVQRESFPAPRYPPPSHGDARMVRWWILGGAALGIAITVILLVTRSGSGPAVIAEKHDGGIVVTAIEIDAAPGDAAPGDGAPGDGATTATDATTDAESNDLADPTKLRTKSELNAAFRAKKYPEIVAACTELKAEGDRAVVCTLAACRTHDERAQEWYRNIAPKQREGTIRFCKQAGQPIEDVCATDGICRQ